MYQIRRTIFRNAITAVWCVSILLTFLAILQTEFCVFINSGRNPRLYTAVNGQQSSLDFCYFEHTVNRFATMLKQKTAGVMIFHPLRPRLSADMSNNIVCFPIAWPCFKMPDFLTVFFSRIPSFSFFIIYSHRRFQHFFFSFQCFGIPNFQPEVVFKY